MSKTKKMIFRIIPVFMLVMVMVLNFIPSNLLAVSTELPEAGEPIGTVTTLGEQIWGTVLTIAQIAAFAALIFAGLRYMFASADQKADIKKQTVILIVGAVFVFGASLIVNILMGVLNAVDPGTV